MCIRSEPKFGTKVCFFLKEKREGKRKERKEYRFQNRVTLYFRVVLYFETEIEIKS
jgi:hypothetical protein